MKSNRYSVVTNNFDSEYPDVDTVYADLFEINNGTLVFMDIVRPEEDEFFEPTKAYCPGEWLNVTKIDEEKTSVRPNIIRRYELIDEPAGTGDEVDTNTNNTR